MVRPRGRVVVLLSALAMVAPGCASGGTARHRPPATGQREDVRAVMTRSVAFFDTTTFTFVLTAGGASMTGAVDGPGSRWTFSATGSAADGTVTAEIRAIGRDVYLRGNAFPFADTGNRWLRLDRGRVSRGAPLQWDASANDPLGAARILDATQLARRTEDGFAGVFDQAEVRTGVGFAISPGATASGSRYRRQVGYQAGLDDEGRLVRLQADFPFDGDVLPVEIRYTDLGAAVAVDRPPAAQVVEATDAVYAALGG